MNITDGLVLIILWIVFKRSIASFLVLLTKIPRTDQYQSIFFQRLLDKLTPSQVDHVQRELFIMLYTEAKLITLVQSFLEDLSGFCYTV
jgi:hypothetical protein